MSRETIVSHDHLPLYRVLRAGHTAPLDSSHSRGRPGRWNTPDFAALYTCCSELTASAVARDRLDIAAVDLDELQAEAHPQLFELDWSGEVVDVTTKEGVESAGFLPTYPDGADKIVTQPLGAEWYQRGHEGVVCRSASLFRLGYADWTGDHSRWGELAIFAGPANRSVRLRQQRTDLRWFLPTSRST